MNLRLHRYSHRGELLSLAVCAGLALLLLFLPGDARVLVADRLAAVLTDPWTRVRDFGQDVVKLRAQNADLQTQLAELELQAAAAARQAADAARMAGPALDPGYTGDLIPCRVVTRQRGRQVTMIKISSAQPVGWRVYQPVVSRTGYLGRVRQIVSPREAWVELLTAPDFALGVELQRTGLVGILRPRASTICVDMIGRDEDVAEGDTVITSGITEVRDLAGAPDGGQTPRGFPLGIVAAVEKPADGMFKEITLRLAATADVNETVFVVTRLGAAAGAGAVRQFLRITLLWMGVAFVGDALVAPMIDIAGRAPDFTIISLVMLALSAGAMPATIGGFLLGLVQDVANPPLLGLRSLCKCVLGFGLGRLRGRLVHGVVVVDAVMIMAAVLLHDFVFLLVQSNLTQERFLVPLLSQSLPTAVYSALVGVPLLRLAESLGVMNPED